MLKIYFKRRKCIVKKRLCNSHKYLHNFFFFFSIFYSKVHRCRFETLPICSCLYNSNTLNISLCESYELSHFLPIKVAKCLFTNIQKQRTLRVNNSKILRIENATFSAHYFYINTNIQGDFQICISVPLTSIEIIFTI